MQNSGSRRPVEAGRRCGRARASPGAPGDHGSSLLDELRALPLEVVDGWLSESLLRRLAGLGDGHRSGAEAGRAAGPGAAIGRTAARAPRGAG